MLLRLSTESPDRPTDLRQDLAAVGVALALERNGALRARQQAQRTRQMDHGQGAADRLALSA